MLYQSIHEAIWEPCGGPAMSGKREGSRAQSSKGRQGPTAAWMGAELCVCAVPSWGLRLLNHVDQGIHLMAGRALGVWGKSMYPTHHLIRIPSYLELPPSRSKWAFSGTARLPCWG